MGLLPTRLLPGSGREPQPLFEVVQPIRGVREGALEARADLLPQRVVPAHRLLRWFWRHSFGESMQPSGEALPTCGHGLDSGRAVRLK